MPSNRSILPLLLALSLYAGPIHAAKPADQVARMEALRSASVASDHESAVELASGIVASNPDLTEAWYLLGRHAEALDRHELAISASSRAWELGYHHMPWIAARIARAAAALGKKELSFEWLRKALAAGLEDRQRIAKWEVFEKYLEDPEFREIAAMAPEGMTRLSGLRSDIDLLVEEAQRLHADPERPAFRAEFVEAADILRKRAGDLTDAEVVHEIQRLTALLGDGHSVSYGPQKESPLKIESARLPIKVYLFEEGMYAIDSYDPATEWLVGRRVVSIGARSPEALLAASRQIHGSDNRMTMIWLGPQFYFTDTEFLRFAEAIGETSEVQLEIERDDGGVEPIVVEAGDYPIIRKLHAPDVIEGEIPLYLRRVDANYWLHELPDHSALYFQFNQVRDDESEPIAAFAERLASSLDADTNNLIIDVRHNNGGNNGLLRPLLRQIIAFDARPGTQVFVITSRNTFSAAQNFITRLERMTEALFVGEPSSSSPNFTGEETELVLPWSRIAISISSRYWQDSDPGDERPWIAPDIRVTPTAKDYFAGRDAAMGAILEIIQ